MSISSVESSPVSADLQTKYHKLATEYAKMRAQVNVLKKAVIDEQSKSTEVMDTLKIKDQSLRKADQEIDSLSFRNQQLTKRVTILQEELETTQNKKKSKSKNASVIPGLESRNNVVDEELQKKIIENANLISMLQEHKEESDKEKFELLNRIEICEHEIMEYKKLISSEEQKQKALMTKLQSENQILVEKLKVKSEEQYLPESRNNHIDSLTNYILHRITNKEFRINLLLLMPSIPFQQFIRSIKLFYSLYSKSLCQLFIVDISSVKHQRLSDAIVRLIEIFESVEELWNSCISELQNDGEEQLKISFEKLLGYFNTLSHTMDEVKSLLKLCIEEENKAMNNENFSSNCYNFIVVYDALHSSWSELWSCIFKVFLHDNNEQSRLQLDGHFQVFISTVTKLQPILKTKFDLLRLKNMLIEENVVQALLTSVREFKDVSSKFIESLKQTTVTLEVPSLSNITPEKSVMTTKPENSKQYSEYYKQEMELMKLTHSKVVKGLEEQIASLSGNTTPQSNTSTKIAQSPTQGNIESSQIDNDFGSLSATIVTVWEADGYDSEIKRFFTTRVSNLVSENQTAESIATTLKTENQALQRRLENSLDCNTALELALQQTQETVGRLQEELMTTTSNYETQLSSMTEHVANMNDRIMAQQEEIEQLKYVLEGKDSRRGKQK